jgi:carboxylesterase type B
MPPHPTTFTPYTFEHPQLGALRGRHVSQETPNVIDFRNIPYANVPTRFKPSVLLDHIPEGFDQRPHRDFTLRGSACPQIPEGLDHFGWQGGPLPDDMPLPLRYDDLEVTTLTIAVPKAALEHGLQKLPVMVYIHGGGLAEGIGHVNGKQNLRRLVEFSVEENMPVIGITLGYRLNWFGFLTCQDLIDEARDDGRGPGSEVFNLGIHDQRKAFLWIKKFVDGFGGDSHNITAFGESGGSLSLAYHLCGDAPLFNRAVLQSCGVIATSSFSKLEERYRLLLQECNITGATAAERLAALRAVDPRKLSKIHLGKGYAQQYWGEDTVFFSRGVPSFGGQFELIRTCPWIDSLIVGADQWEGHILLRMIKNVPSAKAVKFLHDVLGKDEVVQTLLQEYDLSADIPDVLCRLNLATLMGDLMFAETVQRIADTVSQGSDKKVYYYTFGLTNPFPGSDASFSTGHHSVELMYQFLTCNDRFPKGRNKFYERQAKETARRWILFGNGKEPWPRYEKSRKMTAICDDRVGWEDRAREDDHRVSQNDPWGKRRYEGLDLVRQVWENIDHDNIEFARERAVGIALEFPADAKIY